MRSLFRFPDPVNETSARLVAGGVVVEAVAFLVVREWWLLIPLVYGFAARLLTGPTLSPLGQLATRAVTPLLGSRLGVQHRFVPGPPKRFAQGVGLAFTAGAAIGWAAGAPIVTYAVLVGLIVAASLEALLAVCLGCIVYRFIWGCDDCDDISERVRVALASQVS